MFPLECRQIFKHFGGLTALSDVNLAVKQEEILGIIGPNGAGKTTLFNIISGALRPSQGSVFFKGQNLTGMGAPRICKLGIARTYQLVRPFNSLTALENVLIGVSFGRSSPPIRDEGIAAAREILAFVGMGEKSERRAESLTLVEKKHLEIARALATAPELLLLDEVISGLTPTEMLETMETIRRIRQGGVTVIMIEHVMKAVMELCDRVIVLNYGVQIAEGSPREVVGNPDVIEAYLGRFQMAEGGGA
jgi:branched-chain amino acid transport system ATP-binding protein